jgi:hypothetical protein
MNTGGRLAGVTPTTPAVDDTSFAAAKSRVETALAFVKSLDRAQVDGAESKIITWTAGGNDRKKGQRLPATVRPAEFLFLCNDGVQHPASSWSADRKAGLSGANQLAMRRLLRFVASRLSSLRCLTTHERGMPIAEKAFDSWQQGDLV